MNNSFFVVMKYFTFYFFEIAPEKSFSLILF